MPDSGVYLTTSALTIGIPQGTYVTLAGATTAQYETVSGVSTSVDPTTRLVSITWVTPRSSSVRISLLDSKGVRTATTRPSADLSYQFPVALAGDVTFADITIQPLTMAGEAVNAPYVQRVQATTATPEQPAPTPTAPSITSSNLAVTSSGLNITAKVDIAANVAQVVNELTVAIRAAVNPVDNGDLDPTHATMLSLPAGTTSMTFTRALPAGNYNAHLAYQRTAGGAWTHDTTVVPFTVAAPAQAAVAGVSASFDASTRKATVSWTAPTTGTVSATRLDSTGASGTATGIAASLGSYTFTTAIDPAATSFTGTISNGSVDASATISIPAGAVSTPTGTNPLGLRALTAGASVTGAANGDFNVFAGSRVNGLYATWGQGGHWNQQELDQSGSKIQGGKVWALVNGAGGEYGSGKLSTLGRFDFDVAPQFGVRKGDGSGGSWAEASTSTAMRSWLITHFTELKNSWWGDANQRLLYRPCHEFNGNWYARHRVEVGDVAAFVKWWREILFPAWDQVLGDDPRFLLEWCPNRDSSYGYDLRTLHPGAAYVDINGVDYYDFGWQSSQTYTDAAWTAEINSTQNGGPKGIEAHRAFAQSLGLALVVPETGQQFRDNPWFVNKLFSYMKTNGYTGTGSPSGKIIGWAWHNLQGSSPDPNAGGDFFIQKGGALYTGRSNASAAYQAILKGGGLRVVNP